MEYQKLVKAVSVILLVILIVVVLVYAKPFLVPLTFAALLAMLLLPFTRWLEAKGVNRVVATLLSVLVVVAFFAILITFISWQVSGLASDASKIEQQVSQRYAQLRDFVTDKLGIPPEKQQQIVKEQQASSTGKMSGMITGFLNGLGSFLTDTILVLVYIFLFIYYRSRLKNFIIQVVPRQEEDNAQTIVNSAQKVAQKYLTGLSLMIMSLWVMYGIGFSIVGVKNAIFFAILCGLLEIVPFVGNLTGTFLTIAMTLVQGGDTNMVLGIVITYATVQFLQTYILEPLVVGSEVSINPLATIVGIVAGEMVWGIPGMILAIPIMGIVKIVFDHVAPLHPFGYLLGEEKKKKGKSFAAKVKGWFKQAA